MSGKCPFHSDSGLPDPEGVYYNQYLQLDKILEAQSPLSLTTGAPVHDETLFIIFHQVNELWFKQVITEIDSICDIFKSNIVDEKNTLIIVQRLNRIVLILKSVTDIMPIIETMTPQAFMSFRDHLFPASGFQSWQFRDLEIKLGLLPTDRIGKSTEIIASMLKQEHRDHLSSVSEQESLSSLIQKWLERTPGLEETDHSFLETYKQAVDNMMKSKQNLLEKETDERKQTLIKESIEQAKTLFQDIFDIDRYNELYKSHQRKFTHKALMGALMLHVYREIPRFSQPFQILVLLTDIDNQVTKWRYAHSQMVQRMIGSRVGTGKSTGYYYLKSTVSDNYKIFVDLSSLGAYLLPGEFVPSLPPKLEEKISYHP